MSLNYLNCLRALEAAVRHGSFRAAGKELNVTAAAVGQQVRRLEKIVGQNLLMRSSNGFTATEQALRATRRLTEGFDLIRDAADLLQDRQATSRLAITIVPTLAEHWLAPRLTDFWSQHPGIDMRIDSTHTVHFLPHPEFDFGLRYVAGMPGATEEFALFHEWLLPVCTPDLAAHILPGGQADPIGDVPLLHVEAETDDPLWLNWDGWGAQFGIPVPAAEYRLKFKHTTLAIKSAFAGHGMHLAQLSIVMPALTSGQLVAPFGAAGAIRTGYPYRLCRFAGGRMTGLHQSFVDWMKAQGQSTAAGMDAYLAGG